MRRASFVGCRHTRAIPNHREFSAGWENPRYNSSERSRGRRFEAVRVMLAEDPAFSGPSMVCAWLVATGNVPVRSPSAGFPIFWAILPAVVAILIAAAIVAAVKCWRNRSGPERLSVSEQLSHFRSLYEAGELSAEEFARIRTRLGARAEAGAGDTPGHRGRRHTIPAAGCRPRPQHSSRPSRDAVAYPPKNLPKLGPPNNP